MDKEQDMLSLWKVIIFAISVHQYEIDWRKRINEPVKYLEQDLGYNNCYTCFKYLLQPFLQGTFQEAQVVMVVICYWVTSVTSSKAQYSIGYIQVTSFSAPGKQKDNYM